MDTGKTLAKEAVVETNRPQAASSILLQLQEEKHCSSGHNAWELPGFCLVHFVARCLPREEVGIGHMGGMVQR